ncbi:hypothetical protein SOVF_046490 [Spinacia oleracea]|nr:hypothetical protein SOVF_046490 [Spinacia oleracea]
MELSDVKFGRPYINKSNNITTISPNKFPNKTLWELHIHKVKLSANENHFSTQEIQTRTKLHSLRLPAHTGKYKTYPTTEPAALHPHTFLQPQTNTLLSNITTTKPINTEEIPLSTTNALEAIKHEPTALHPHQSSENVKIRSCRSNSLFNKDMGKKQSDS